MRKGSVRGDIEADVLSKGEELVYRRQGLCLPGPGKKDIEGQDKSKRRQDSSLRFQDSFERLGTAVENSDWRGDYQV